eukprot:TRINITY_DN19241_c0_g1_i4.p1 TRINITY_DN19241_c0_g1~~TRINITY_DN19241_c0_g1_i4.p1  ORF type:complete len:1187 (+),score=305.46 TRINITY_DN19241_c0_g1_i4:44-3604(+)
MEPTSRVQEYVKGVRPLRIGDVSQWDYNKISDVVKRISQSPPAKRKGLQEINLNTAHTRDEDRSKAEALTMTGMGSKVVHSVGVSSMFPTTPMPQCSSQRSVIKIADDNSPEHAVSACNSASTSPVPSRNTVVQKETVPVSTIEDENDNDLSLLRVSKQPPSASNDSNTNYSTFTTDDNNLNQPPDQTSSSASLVEWYKQRLQKERSNWKTKHSELVASQDRLLAERLEVEEQLKDAERSQAKLKSTLDKVTSQVTNSDIISQQLAKTKLELEAAKRRQRELEQATQYDGTSLRRRCESAEGLCSELKSETTQLQERLTLSQEEVISKTTEIRSLQESNQTLRSIETDLHNQVEHLSLLLSDTTTQKGTLDRELQMVKLELQDAKFEVSHSDKRLSVLTKASDECQKEVLHLREAASEAATANCELTIENQHLQQRVSLLTDDLQRSTSMRTSDVSSLRGQLSNLESQYKELVANNETRISDIQRRHVNEVDQLQHRLQQKEQHYNDLMASKTDLLRSLDEERLARAEASVQIENLEHQLANARQDYDLRESRCNELARLLETEQTRHSETIAQLSKEQERCSDLMRLNTDISFNIEDEQLRHSQTAQKVDKLQSELRESNNRCSDAAFKLEDEVLRHSQTAESNKQLQKSLSEEKELNHQLKDMISKMKADLTEQIKENANLSFLIEDERSKQAQAANTTADIQGKLSELLASADIVKETHEQELSQFQRKAESLEQLLRDTENERGAAMSDLFASRESQAALENQLFDKNEELSTLRATASEAMKQKSDLEQRLKRVTDCNTNAQQALVELDKLTEMHLKERSLRRKYYNQLVELRGNMRVVCRIRPPTAETQIPFVSDDEVIELQSKSSSGKSRSFRFDDIISAEADQLAVFKSSAEDLIQSLLDGFNICIMAYGQTGSGKTYTMFGKDIVNEAGSATEGVIPRSLSKFWSSVEAANIQDVNVTLSVVEIYCGEVRDLLTDFADTTNSETAKYMMGSIVTHKVVNVTCLDDCMQLISSAYSNRAISSTNCNERSSRSHCLVTLNYSGVFSIRGKQVPVSSKMVLVDLGGSECVSKAGIAGKQVQECSHINKSLCALSDVLSALSHGRTHVPYRNSKLTHLLADCLGGDAKMLLFVNINTGSDQLGETLHSLSFGHKARQIPRGPVNRNIAKAVTLVSPQRSEC